MSTMDVGNRINLNIGASDLRALIHWASIGVRKSSGGSYSDHIERIVAQQARRTNFKLAPPCEFGQWLEPPKKTGIRHGRGKGKQS